MGPFGTVARHDLYIDAAPPMPNDPQTTGQLDTLSEEPDGLAEVAVEDGGGVDDLSLDGSAQMGQHGADSPGPVGSNSMSEGCWRCCRPGTGQYSAWTLLTDPEVVRLHVSAPVCCSDTPHQKKRD